jgi:choloylglycine hydrolase
MLVNASRGAHTVLALFLAGALACVARPALACTSFLLRGGAGGTGRVMAKSYDWGFGHGRLLLNPRGVAKQALSTRPGGNPARWESRYASVTFTQFGREVPLGGMNEAGLMVEVLWLEASQYPRPDARPTVNELQWIQMQLDRHATVAEMIKGAGAVRVERVHARVHYLACDRSGACAAFEHLDGRLQVAPGATVLTNNTHASSMADVERQRNHWIVGSDSRSRFQRTWANLERPSGGDPVTAAFTALDDVRWYQTQWQIVYDPLKLQVHFRTRQSPVTKRIELSRLDGTCGPTVMALDLDVPVVASSAGGAGLAEVDVTGRLSPFSRADNARLIERSMRSLGRVLPPGAVEALASYPESLQCSPAQSARR